MQAVDIMRAAGCTVMSPSSDKEAWLRDRATMWTASDVAKLCGLDDDSRETAIKAKANNTFDAEVGSVVQVRAGYFLEDGIVAWYADDCLFPVVGNKHLVTSPVFSDRVGATPDALEVHDEVTGEVVPLEVKNVQYESAMNWHLNTTKTAKWEELGLGPFPIPVSTHVLRPFLSSKVAAADARTVRGAFRRHCISLRVELLPYMGPIVAPIKYWVQLQIQMGVLGATTGRIVCCMAGTSRYTLTYHRDDAFLAFALAQCASAWQDVQRRRDRL